MTKPQRVDFLANNVDMQVLIYGELGMSTRYITGKTLFSPGQVSYRLRKASVRRMDYRDGTSAVAKAVIRQAREFTESQIRRGLRA